MQTLEATHLTRDAAVPVTELVLAGNGPGELAGWIRPTAEAARALARADGRPLRLTLALLPSQFAGGGEPEAIRSWQLFDRILLPTECLRLAAGLGSVDVSTGAALVHLGGDLLLSSRLAARLGIAACAFSETMLIANRHRGFARILVPTDSHAARLRARGVPPEKLVITGDPRAAAPARARQQIAAPGAADRRGETVALFPGSRDRLFRTALPLFAEMAAALAPIRPQAAFDVIVAPFISAATARTVREETARRWPALELRWVTDPAWADLARATFAVTLPGSSTVELAAAGVPFVTVVDLNNVGAAAVEGPLEWVARITGLRGVIARRVLERYRRHMRFVALPNQRAGREIAPEWIGRWDAAGLAKVVEDLLNDHAALAGMAAALARVYEDDAAAPSRIAAAALALAGTS